MIKLILVDKHQVFLESVTQCLKGEDDFLIVGQATDGLEALRLVNKNIPNVIVTDLSMPVVNGLELISKLKESNPEIKFLIMSGPGQADSLKVAIALGARGFVSKSASIGELKKAIRLIDSGYSYFDSNLPVREQDNVTRTLSKYHRSGVQENWKLTAGEKRILRLIMKGLTSREIGQQLRISERTVQNHRANIMKKFHVKNLVELVKFSLKNQFLYN